MTLLSKKFVGEIVSFVNYGEWRNFVEIVAEAPPPSTRPSWSCDPGAVNIVGVTNAVSCKKAVVFAGPCFRLASIPLAVDIGSEKEVSRTTLARATASQNSGSEWPGKDPQCSLPKCIRECDSPLLRPSVRQLRFVERGEFSSTAPPAGVPNLLSALSALGACAIFLLLFLDDVPNAKQDFVDLKY
jgi:hypothetical protein